MKFNFCIYLFVFLVGFITNPTTSVACKKSCSTHSLNKCKKEKENSDKCCKNKTNKKECCKKGRCGCDKKCGCNGTTNTPHVTTLIKEQLFISINIAPIAINNLSPFSKEHIHKFIYAGSIWHPPKHSLT